jgi:hypothetical protein
MEKSMPVQFLDRRDAVRQLATKLTGYAGDADVLVVGLPRGGVRVMKEPRSVIPIEPKNAGTKSLKGECIRPGTPLSLEDARRLVQDYIEHYNNVRVEQRRRPPHS